jgi:hypothetical protein
MRPAYATLWTTGVVDSQIAIIASPYRNVVLTIARIRVPHVVMIGEMEYRSRVEIPVGVIVPGPPRIISIIAVDHPDAGQIGIAFDLDVLHVNSLPAFGYYVNFHHSIDHVFIG